MALSASVKGVNTLTPREAEKIILADGWYFKRQTGDHKHYGHDVKQGTVTISFQSRPKDIPKKTLASIFKQAGLDKKKYLYDVHS